MPLASSAESERASSSKPTTSANITVHSRFSSTSAMVATPSVGAEPTSGTLLSSRRAPAAGSGFSAAECSVITSTGGASCDACSVGSAREAETVDEISSS